MRIRSAIFPGLVSVSLCAALTGCGAYQGTATNTIPMAEISGKVHGGQQPIVGAQVYLYAAGTLTSGSAGYGSGATSLLNSPGYVTTASDGSFSLNGAYSLAACQRADQQVYLVSVGGNPGAGTNTNAVLMAALGDCNSFSSGSYVWINEVTTVASVVALQQFMTPGTYNVGTSLTNQKGLKNAFLTVPNLVNISTGTALATTPNGNGTVPQNEINYLANILAACVNSTTGSTQCSDLFMDATPPGGTAPTDTLGAMLDIALNPGNNVGPLYLLPPPAVAFPTTLSQPNDWTIAVKYSGGGLRSPLNMAVDASGDVWVTNAGGATGIVSEFSTTGVSLQGASGTSNGHTGSSQGIAITPSGMVWVGAYGGAGLYSLSSTGAYQATYTSSCASLQIASDAVGNVWQGNGNGRTICKTTPGGTSASFAVPTYLGGTAIDAAGNVWAGIDSTGVAVEVNSSGSLVSGEPTTGWADAALNDGQATAIDASGNAWIANYNNALVTELSPSGVVLSGSGYSIAHSAQVIAIDGNSTVWTGNSDGSLSHLSNAGAAISPTAGYKLPGNTAVVFGLALDASGNVWTSLSSSYLVEWVGLAAPVATPMAQNLLNSPTTIGQRP